MIYGCANQAGEDNRNVARMAVLLAGLPATVPGTTINRLCGSGLDAVGTAARAIRAGEAELMIAGGVESMTRAPFVMPQGGRARSPAQRRDLRHHDRLALRQSEDEKRNTASTRCRRRPRTSPPTSASAARTRTPSPRSQPGAAGPRHRKPAASREEIVPVTIPQKKGEPIVVDATNIPRPDTTLEALAKLRRRSRRRRHASRPATLRASTTAPPR